MVITVLLKVAATCATPEVMFLRSLRRGRAAAAGFAIVCGAPYNRRTRSHSRGIQNPNGRISLLGNFFLARDRDRFAFTRARVGMCALTAHRQAFAMPQTAIAAQIHEPLDVHRHFTPLVTLDLIVPVCLLYTSRCV